MDIRRLGPGDEQALEKVGPQFDKAVEAAAGTRFLNSQGHHILVAYEGEAVAGFVTGVEMTHPDKGTEMFLYELAVDPTLAKLLRHVGADGRRQRRGAGDLRRGRCDPRVDERSAVVEILTGPPE